MFNMISSIVIPIFLSVIFDNCNSMIITSVFAGPKKYKTVTFDLFPFPLSYSVPNKKQFAYRGHYTLKRPNFNVDMSMPVTIPLNFDHVQPTIGFNQDGDHEYSEHGNSEHSEDSYSENNHEENTNYGGNYETSESNEEYDQNPNIEDSNIEHSNVESDSMSEGMYSNKIPPSREKLPAYILNGENEIKSPSDTGRNHQGIDHSLPNLSKYAGYESKGPDEPRPYTGKAQVSSFIDNGQFVNAHSPVVSKTQKPEPSFGGQSNGQPMSGHSMDGQFGGSFGDSKYSDDRSSNTNSPRRISQRFDIEDRLFNMDRSSMRKFVPTLSVSTLPVALSFPIAEKIYAAKKHKGKTVSMGYNTKAEEPTHHPITVHARNPDSLPWGLTDYTDIQKYYTTFQFTDQFRGPVINHGWRKRRGLLSKGFINLG